MKILINTCYGGFSVSKKLYEALGLVWEDYGYLENKDFDIVKDHPSVYRSHPRLIEAVETLGLEASSGPYVQLKIVEIPDNISWYLNDYDGIESIHETHRSWN